MASRKSDSRSAMSEDPIPMSPHDADGGSYEGTTDSTSSTSCNDDNSINSSDEALCEILGLPSLTGMGMVIDEEDVTKENITAITASETKSALTSIVPRKIELPSNRGVSRKYHPSEDCFAYEITNVLSPIECSRLIEVAANSALPPQEHQSEESHSTQIKNPTPTHSFRYVTHAIHTAPDGKTKFKVALERPNPHKLAVFRHDAWVQTLWDRLGPVLLGDEDLQLREPLDRFVARESLESSISPSPSTLVTGLNPRLRVLRYDASDQDEFQGHFDATTEIHELKQTSYLTVLLYLNGGGGKDFDGGETEFLSQEEKQQQQQRVNDDSMEKKETVKITPKVGSVVLFEHDLFHRGRPLLWGTKYVLRTDIMFENPSHPSNAEKRSDQWKDTQGKEGTTPPPPDDDAESATSTVEEVLFRITEDTESDDDALLLLRDALAEGLGFGKDLENTSIGCLCSPGRFALNLMLREHMRAMVGDSNQRIIDRFLDAAFEALKDQHM